WLAARLRKAVARDGYGLLVLSEGVPAARTLAETLPEQTGYRVRDIRLGHAQRGATPSHRDRTLAVHLAYCAYHALLNNLLAGTVVVKAGRPQLHDGLLVNSPPRQLDQGLYRFINGL
ncbi:6-phosphofructokinase, partial [Chloroflexota bacterium]